MYITSLKLRLNGAFPLPISFPTASQRCNNTKSVVTQVYALENKKIAFFLFFWSLVLELLSLSSYTRGVCVLSLMGEGITRQGYHSLIYESLTKGKWSYNAHIFVISAARIEPKATAQYRRHHGHSKTRVISYKHKNRSKNKTLLHK